MRSSTLSLIAGILLMCCHHPEEMTMVHRQPPLYPDYTGVTIPVNIAPLNFLMRDSTDKMVVKIVGHGKSLTIKGSNKISIPLDAWKEILSEEQGRTLTVELSTRVNGRWLKYDPFQWHVTAERIDPWLSYRLIEPGYEVWNKIQIVERNTESFNERILADNNLLEGRCMNCHIYGNQQSNLSMFHVRGANGGTILNRDGRLRKIDTRAKGMISNATYGNFHPSGRYVVFSTNIVIPELHAYKSERLEVYDSASDLVVLDLEKNEIISQPFLSDSTAYETFPVFSADGNQIYFCSAPYVPLPDSIRSLKYNICRVSFDPVTREMGREADTLWNAKKMGGSASHLKTSPDGKYLLYTVANYGTFPIWHREANLQMMNLQTGSIDSLKKVNGPNSDSYHSWSSNSRWFVFASKRDDGIYGKPYFCYIDSAGNGCKPFVLPQEDPETYDNTLKSFNIPELSTGQVPFDANDIENLIKNTDAEKVKQSNHEK